MRNLIPHFIVKNLLGRNLEGEFEAYSMFIDISGFTTMTQSLVKNGKEGAEILTEIINNIFTPSIEEIYKYRGFISGFAGDAFTSIFPVQKGSADSVIGTALLIQDLFTEIGTQQTKFGKFNLNIKIGISLGKVVWRILQTDVQTGYYFKGDAIGNSADCENKAGIGKIVIDRALQERTTAKTTGITENFFEVGSISKKKRAAGSIRKLSFEELKYFIPDSILHLKSKGEFRNVISCFISFRQKGKFYESLAEIIDLSIRYGGYFNKIDFGDKGGVVLVLFGAPISREMMEIRACDFALAVSKLDRFECRIGISSGIAFAGFVGSERRGEYTALGREVNLAARFMMKAADNDIFLDADIFRKINRSYTVEFLDNLNYKGFSDKIPTYRLLRKKEKSATFLTEGKFIARESEFDKLHSFIAPLQNQNKDRFAGIIYIEGAAGVGKSRLVKELKRSLDRESYRWVYMPCDAILRKSFNPVLYFLHNLFEQHEDFSRDRNKENFEKIFKRFTRENRGKYQKELIRTKSFLAALLDIYWKDSLYDQLDAKSRYENTLLALTNLLKVLSLEKPLIVEFEDANWIDNDSGNFLENMLVNIGEFPIAVVASCRNNDDGTPFFFDLKQENEENRHLLNIENFSREQSEMLISSLLSADQKIAKQTIDSIWEKSRGNPFFIEQIVMFLQEQNITDDSFRLRNDDFQIPSNINSLIISRIDKLEPDLKTVTKNASVLGIKFTRNILRSMVREKSISEYLHDGEKEKLWHRISEFDHIFQNSFIREGIYGLILKKELRQMHKTAADVYEKIHHDDIEKYYADLAYNYEKAEIRDKTVYYLEKAGDYERKLFHNQTALHYYRKLIDFLRQNRTSSQMIVQKIKLNIAELLLIQSRTGDAIAVLDELEKEDLKKIGLRERFVFLKAKYYAMKEDFSNLMKYAEERLEKLTIRNFINHLKIYLLDSYRYLNRINLFETTAQELLTEFQTTGEKHFEELLTNIMGIFYIGRADYKTALRYFQHNFRIANEENDKLKIKKALHNMGVVFSRMGNRQEAMNYYLKSLDISEEIGDLRACSKLYSDIAIIHTSEGATDKAIEFYSKGLELAKDIGNKMQEELILYNLADTYIRREDYRKALQLLEKSKKICIDISDKMGISFVNDLHGDILFTLNRYDEAKKIYMENLAIQSELNDREGIAHTYGNLGNIARTEQKFDQSVEYYRKQQEILAEVGDKEGEGKTFFNWALIDLDRNEPEKARPKLEKALKLFTECSFRIGIDAAFSELEKLHKGSV